MAEYFYNVYELTKASARGPAHTQWASVPYTSRSWADESRKCMSSPLYRPVCMVHVTRCISTEAGLAKSFADYAEKVRREAEEGHG